MAAAGRPAAVPQGIGRNGSDVRVLALGSPHGDDRVAWHVAERLEQSSLQGVRVSRLSSPWDLLDHLARDRGVVVLDACRLAGRPDRRPRGSVIRCDAASFRSLPKGRTSTHAGDLKEILQLAERLGRLPAELVILAVEIDSAAPGAELSAQGAAAARALEWHVRNELIQWKSVGIVSEDP